MSNDHNVRYNALLSEPRLSELRAFDSATRSPPCEGPQGMIARRPSFHPPPTSPILSD